MLGRAPALVPALVTHPEVFLSPDSSKRFCKAWPRGGSVDFLAEPTSVLDIHSPSPSLTLSSSLAGSCESGVQGSIESGAVAVSGLFCEGASEGQLPDCTSLLDRGSEVGSVWDIEAGEDGRADEEIVGTWQAGNSGGDLSKRGWERNLGHITGSSMYEGVSKHVEGPSGTMKGGNSGMANVGANMGPGFTQAFSTEIQSQGDVPKAEQFNFAPASSTNRGTVLGDVTDTMVKNEAVADESLEACVMSCRKRDRSDLLGEVVQRLGDGIGSVGVGGPKIEAGEWLSDWHEFATGASAMVVDEKIAPGHLEDLEDIFSGSPPPGTGAAEFWLGESLPSGQQQVQSQGMGMAMQHSNVGHVNQPAGARVQLDLYEAVQAGLLYKGGSNTGSSMSGAMASGGPTTFSPSIPTLARTQSAPLTSPLQQTFSLVGSPRPFFCHSFGSSAPPTIPWALDFLDAKVRPLASASPSLLNAIYAPPPPQFSSLPFQESPFPLTSYKQPQLPQPQHFGLPKPEYGPHKAELGDPKLWQMHALEGDGPPKVVPGGSRWQIKPGLGRQQVPVLNRQLTMPTEQVQRHHAIMPEYVGRCVRLDELSLAERHLSAISEAARQGDFGSAQAILARLNQQSSPKGQQQQQQHPPSQRVTLLISEGLARWVSAGSSSTVSCPFQQAVPNNTLLDLINKISAYKSLCEVSPISQFAHFTANQAILDAMEGEDSVHVIDFELGFGGQWASFMQEISQRSRGAPELKITTMGEDSLEMRLAKENLLQFAKEVGMKVQINVLPLQKLEGLKAAMVKKGEKEAVAVNFGFGLRRLMADFTSSDGLLNFFQLIKGWSPKVIAVVDMECEFEGKSSLSDALQFFSCVFESLEASPKLAPEVVHHIEKFIFGPKICDVVHARCAPSSGDSSLPPWRILLQKAGFSTVPFSPAAESQAAWLVKNPPNAGFTFIKQHTTLLLGWYNKTLVSATAWV